jgi:hypothetical protein
VTEGLRSVSVVFCPVAKQSPKPRLPHHRKHQHWHGRQQQFWWVNDITYSYEGDRNSLLVHVVGCKETWQEVDPESGELIAKQTQHVWLSSQPLDPYNVHERCNLGARQRWGIETSLLVEKCQGYHYLMRLAHLVNALALATNGWRAKCARWAYRRFCAGCARVARIAGYGVSG